MITPHSYTYRTGDGHSYKLYVDYKRRRNSVTVLGAELHKNDGMYVGYWECMNMPLSLVELLRKWVLRNCPTNEPDKAANT